MPVTVTMIPSYHSLAGWHWQFPSHRDSLAAASASATGSGEPESQAESSDASAGPVRSATGSASLSGSANCHWQ